MLSPRIDQFLRDHPYCFIGALVLLTALVMVLSLGQGSGTEVLYKTF
jgi:hypothetical protein